MAWVARTRARAGLAFGLCFVANARTLTRAGHARLSRGDGPGPRHGRTLTPCLWPASIPLETRACPTRVGAAVGGQGVESKGEPSPSTRVDVLHAIPGEQTPSSCLACAYVHVDGGSQAALGLCMPNKKITLVGRKERGCGLRYECFLAVLASRRYSLVTALPRVSNTRDFLEAINQAGSRVAVTKSGRGGGAMGVGVVGVGKQQESAESAPRQG